MGDEDQSPDPMVEGVSAMVGAGASTLATTNPVAGAILGAGLTTGSAWVLDTLGLDARKRADRWYKALLDDETRSPESAAEQVAERLKDPKYSQAVRRAIRAVVNTPDESTILPLVRLHKLHEGGLDRQHFGMIADLLEESSERDIDELRCVLLFVTQQRHRHCSSARVTANASAAAKFQITFEPYVLSQAPFVEDVDPARIVHLLTKHGLMRRTGMSNSDGESGIITMERAVVLMRVLGMKE